MISGKDRTEETKLHNLCFAWIELGKGLQGVIESDHIDVLSSLVGYPLEW